MFNQTLFEEWYSAYSGNTYTVPANQVGFFNDFRDTYERQLVELGIFNFTGAESVQTYNIPYCSLEFLPIPLWKTITSVKKIDIVKGTETLLLEGVHFYHDNLTKKVILGNEYIIALNFACLSCNCSCQKIRIEGQYALDFPISLRNDLFLVIFNNMKNKADPDFESCDDIESISAGNITIKKSTTKVEDKTDVNNIFSYPKFRGLGLVASNFLKIY